ncbi:unnamed protein product, partial [Didymodactylos carnosus]
AQFLNDDEKLVLGYLGITEEFLGKKASQYVVKQTVDTRTLTRFYVTLILYDLWKNNSIYDVARYWQIPRGTIQYLYSQAGQCATSILYFTKVFDNLWPYQDLLPTFIRRLTFCTSLEILPLMEIHGIKQGRALQLARAGYKTLKSLARANVNELMKDIPHLPHKVALTIIKNAAILLKQQIEDLKDQAAELEG